MIKAITTGWYYLLGNGDLAYKPNSIDVVEDLQANSLIVGLWPFNGDRECAWTILVEARAAGADLARVKQLAEKWKCGDSDALIYAEKIGVDFNMDGTTWCAQPMGASNIQESPTGFGCTALDALAELALAVGYQPSKLWGASFQDLLQKVAS